MWQVSLSLILMLLAPAAAQQLSDPTAPPRTISTDIRQVASNNLRLQAIHWNGTKRVAQINGERVSQGDSLQNYKVQEITMHQVVLSNSQNNERVTLRLFASSLHDQQPGSQR